jgi:hypothetical protein
VVSDVSCVVWYTVIIVSVKHRKAKEGQEDRTWALQGEGDEYE